jgi:hypothetical protein
MKKMIFVLFAAVLALSACSPAAKAADYTYVSGSYTTVDVRDYSFDGYGLEGSLSLGDHLFVEAGYTNSDDSDFGAGVAKVGVGFRDAVTENTDLYGVGSALIKVDNRADFDKYTYEVEVGLRTQLFDRVEVRGGVIATDVTRSSEFLGTAGAEFAVTKNIRIAADLVGKKDVLGGQLGVRLYF